MVMIVPNGGEEGYSVIQRLISSFMFTKCRLTGGTSHWRDGKTEDKRAVVVIIFMY